MSNTDTTMIGVDAESAPNLTPEQCGLLTIEIQPGSLIGPDGQPIANGQIGISTVPPELVRDMLPPGLLQHTFDITVQAPGITNFATPAKMTFPNVFNAAPGTQLNFLNFDHTTGRLVIEGTATVSADGLTVTTDPDSGITHPGWHGVTPPGSNGTEGGAGEKNKKPPKCPDGGNGLEKGMNLAFAIGKLAIEFVPLLRGAKCLFAVAESTYQIINDALSFQSRGSRGCIALGLLKLQLSRTASLLDGCIPIEGVLGKIDNIVSAIDAILGAAGAGAAIAECGKGDVSGWIKTAQDLVSVAHQTASRLRGISPGRQLLSVASDLIKKLDEQICAPPVAPAVVAPSHQPIFELHIAAEVDEDVALDEETRDLLGRVADLLRIFADEGAHYTAESLAGFDQTLVIAVNSNANVGSQFIDMAIAGEDEDGALSASRLFYKITNLDNDQAAPLQGRLGTSGEFESVFLTGNTLYQVEYVDPHTLQAGRTIFRTSSSGTETRIRTTLLENSEGPDSDADGLTDEIENTINTSPSLRDTDFDGLSDHTEVIQDLDPFGGRSVMTGVIASTQLQGEAKEIVIGGSTDNLDQQAAYLATGSFGLAVVDVTQFQQPAVRSQLDLPGDATDVASDAGSGIAVVA